VSLARLNISAEVAIVQSMGIALTLRRDHGGCRHVAHVRPLPSTHAPLMQSWSVGAARWWPATSAAINRLARGGPGQGAQRKSCC